MHAVKKAGLLLVVLLAASVRVSAQETPPPIPDASQQDLSVLLDRLKSQEARLKELEAQVARLTTAPASQPSSANTTASSDAATSAAPSVEAAPSAAAATVESTPAPAPQAEDAHEHTMQLPGGGPVLKVRGFADFNLGLGSDANPLIFPLPAPVHNTFQIGEFDLFLSSRLSRKVSFLSELVIGADQTNFWGLDIERLQVSYKPSHYFEISGGRYHTSIGYYNTAFHHGTWFQTATGRPFMYFFEDSGGILPVHSVGITTTGLVPHSGKLELHWVAEVGNGRSSDPAGQPVQNFLSDKNHKDFNFAAFIKPEWLPGLQVGGSFYRDRLIPFGIPHVDENIGSLYAVYINSSWELLNEAVLIHNKIDGLPNTFNSPLAYTQMSRKFGRYRPYFRFQYLNVPAKDPVNIYTGRYDGPSVGLRMDFTEYAALKVQYNRLYQRDVDPANGVDLQVAFTF